MKRKRPDDNKAEETRAGACSERSRAGGLSVGFAIPSVTDSKPPLYGVLRTGWDLCEFYAIIAQIEQESMLSLI